MSGAMTSAAPSSTRATIAGTTFVAAAFLLWLAWALMPDAATADASHILDAVGAMRERVAWSARVQLLASALFAPGLLFVARRGGRATFWGAALLSVGAMGMAADAVYHQLAVEMTAPGIDRAMVLPAMVAMQTRDIRTLVPLMLAFLVGVPVLVVGLRRDRRIDALAAWLVAAAPVLVVAGALAAVAFGFPRRFVALGMLGVLCASLASVGRVLARGDDGP